VAGLEARFALASHEVVSATIGKGEVGEEDNESKSHKRGREKGEVNIISKILL